MKSNDRGAAAVEFAIVLIPLLLIVFGVIDFGRIFYTQVTLDHAAREAVRVVSLEGDDAEDVAEAAAAPVLVDSVDVTTDCVSDTEAKVELKTTVSGLLLVSFVPGMSSSKELTAVGAAKCFG